MEEPLVANDIDHSSLEQLTFRDGYVFALSNVGIVVWKGDLQRGYFNPISINTTINYIKAASPS